MRRLSIIFSAVVCVFTWMVSYANAEIIVDQSFRFESGSGRVFSSAGSHYSAQTFTVGATGILNSIALPLSVVSPGVNPILWVDIRPTEGGIPVLLDSESLVSISLNQDDLPVATGSRDLDVVVPLIDAGIQVHAGEVYAVVVHSDSLSDGVRYGLHGGIDRSYSRGDRYFRFFDNAAFDFREGDIFFETTVVTVPEPCCPILFGCLAVFCRRSRS